MEDRQKTQIQMEPLAREKYMKLPADTKTELLKALRNRAAQCKDPYKNYAEPGFGVASYLHVKSIKYGLYLRLDISYFEYEGMPILHIHQLDELSEAEYYQSMQNANQNPFNWPVEE